MTAHLTTLYAGFPKKDQSRLAAIAAFSKKHLRKLRRRSGESYLEHCSEVAATLREASDDVELLSVALLHDLPVHPDGKELLIAAPLREKEKELVRQMHTLRRLHIDENTKDLDTVIDAFLEQPELLPLRMAHRVNDMRNLKRFGERLRMEISRESLHMYSAIAGRLGMHRWRVEMEDGAFPVVQPKLAENLREHFLASSPVDTACLTQTRDYLNEEFHKHGIDAVIETRLKSLYSTYRKMVIKDRGFHELTDRLALRIVVKNVEHCYLALGVIHAVMRPMPGKLKDYIGAPKENGYRSIHTVVFPLPGVTEQPIEMQIRTQDMHEQCEFGSCSHGDYKHSMYALTRKPARVNLFRNLQSLRDEASSPKQFEEALRMYFREDHIAVFDAENNLYHLKEPASAMDFACLVYPKKCHRIKQIPINGRKQPVGVRLHDGDAVEVQFSRDKRSRKEWIDACFHKATKKKLREEMRSHKTKTSV